MTKETERKAGGHGAVSQEDRRGDPRFPLSTSADVIDPNGDVHVKGRTTDIAKQGCYVDTINPFPPKSTVTLRIMRDNESFETQAKVVYSQLGMGMGLSFTTTEPDQLHMLERWLGELSGELPPPEPDKPAPPLQFEIGEGPVQLVDQDARDVLSELILVLSRKGAISGHEGNVILQRLFKKTE
jgi:hypothetical protein